jgi:hypothetical protein
MDKSQVTAVAKIQTSEANSDRQSFSMAMYENLSNKQKDLLNADDGSCSSIEAAKILAITVAELAEFRSKSKVLAFPLDEGYVYPRWQFTSNGTLDGLHDVLSAFGSGSSWLKASFLLKNRELPGFVNPVDALRAGKSQQVVNLVKSIGEHGAS